MKTLFNTKATCAVCKGKEMCGGVVGFGNDLKDKLKIYLDCDLHPLKREALLQRYKYSLEAYVCKPCAAKNGKDPTLKPWYLWIISAVLMICMTAIAIAVYAGGKEPRIGILLLPYAVFTLTSLTLTSHAGIIDMGKAILLVVLAFTPLALFTVPGLRKLGSEKNLIQSSLEPLIPEMFKTKYADAIEQDRLAARTPQQVCHEEGHVWETDWNQQGTNGETGASWNDDVLFCPRCGCGKIIFRTTWEGRTTEDTLNRSYRIKRQETEDEGRRQYCPHVWKFVRSVDGCNEDYDIRYSSTYSQCVCCGIMQVVTDDDGSGRSIDYYYPLRS